VDIQLHISLLLILPYLVFVTRVRFAELTRTAGVSAEQLSLGPTGWGVVMALALFSSILIHELGHVLVALRQGARVRGITLMMLGGVSTIDEIKGPPKQEFTLAIIGPIVSLGIAAASCLAFRASGNSNFSFFTHWFAQVNLVLGIFNLLPAFPLDGGRAFRALLEVKMGKVRATRIAARATTSFAWLLGFVGVLGFNLFLILIAFFIHTAAQAELSVILARELLHGLSAGDITTQARAISGGSSLLEATSQMLKSRQTILPVELATAEYSIITLQEIRTIPERLRSSVKVKDLVRPAERVLNAEQLLNDVLTDLLSSPWGALPVQREGQLLGYIRQSDLNEVMQLRSIERKVEGTEEEPTKRVA